VTKGESELREENLRLLAENQRLCQALAKSADARQDCEAREAHCRSILELAADAILIGDSKGNFTSANQSAVSLTGYPLEELLGKNLRELFSKEEQLRSPLRYDLLHADVTVQNERMLTRRDGSTLAVWMNSRRMPDGGYQTFMRDNSERKALEEKLLTLISDLEAFTFSVAHDLRSPLSNIFGFCEILKLRCKEKLDSESFGILERIAASAETMLALIENLLALARAEKLDRPQAATATGAVVTKVLADLAPQFEAAGVGVNVGPLPDLYLPEVLVQQIFSNLLGNALIHAPRPETTIQVCGSLEGETATLLVRDHGPGVADEERERIFEAFYRSKSAGGTHGSGLGLAIVAKIAGAYGGRTWVEATPGGGSTFMVELLNPSPPQEP